jgi:hypothetical protein
MPAWYAAGGGADYAFRGIALGIPIDEFRKLSHPDSHQHPNSRPICTGDPEAKDAYGGIGISDIEAKIGLKKCNFFSRKPSLFRPGKLDWDSDNFLLGNATVLAYFYFLPDAESSAYRLFQIYVPIQESNFDQLFSLYLQRFGTPTSVKNQTVQNAFGATFDDVKAVWINGNDNITLIKRAGAIDSSVIIYRYAPISELYDKETRNAKSRANGRL